MIAPSSVMAQNQPFASYESSYNHGSWKLEVPQPPWQRAGGSDYHGQKKQSHWTWRLKAKKLSFVFFNSNIVPLKFVKTAKKKISHLVPLPCLSPFALACCFAFHVKNLFGIKKINMNSSTSNFAKAVLSSGFNSQISLPFRFSADSM